MRESRFQSQLITKLKMLFPDCVILKNDAAHQQGMLDLTVLWNDRWASLELKGSATADVQPNQEYYVDKLGKMSFAAFIYPENETEVLSALQQAFKPPRRTRVSQS